MNANASIVAVHVNVAAVFIIVAVILIELRNLWSIESKRNQEGWYFTGRDNVGTIQFGIEQCAIHIVMTNLIQ